MAIYERMTLKPRAGALPEYNRQTENYVSGQSVSVRVDDSAARIAGAGQEAEARALGGIGNLGSLWLRYGNKGDTAPTSPRGGLRATA